MELALSLGDASKPFKFLDNTTPKNNKMIPNKDLGFCMGLATSGFAPRSQDKTHDHSHEGDDDDGDRRRVLSSDRPVQLDLLPFSPVHPARRQIPFPWLSDNMVSEPGSTDGSGGDRGFDVNRLSVEEAEEGATLSSPNSAASSFQMDFGIRSSGIGRGNKRDMECFEAERGSSRASDDDENGLTRKKLRLSKEQSAFLEESFKEHNTLNPKQKLALAKQLNLRPRQVEVWFQNRRARTKLKQTEVDCEYLKRCCEMLTEENRRLQKELQELRALKTSQPFYMQLPATTLTMCPSCERVATTTTSSSGTTTTTTNNNNGSSKNNNPVATTAATTPSSTALSLANKPKLYPFSSHSQTQLPQAQSHKAAS
ncbi:homeobox-leucine zipper protein HOX11 [Ricinus communis]|uniref:Homeobox-leucine zipper protein HAT14, putative n=1 Tax=Ricinus communis TaxID=3988 RepID=B9T8G8_RICCO|nr:homeobox-leucine zipper protein HOX11 [Ricinus communis]EEF27847.1 Homeobox-leucine zipper protein HAT14, putative [Ricinus communis]|eukprot:XP_002534537.1 homeobox-leucine zipper protein HOX11 [Ricinus communis]